MTSTEMILHIDALLKAFDETPLWKTLESWSSYFKKSINDLAGYVEASNNQTAGVRNYYSTFAPELKKPAHGDIVREIDHTKTAFSRFVAVAQFADYNYFLELLYRFEQAHENYLKNQNLRQLFNDLYAANELYDAYRMTVFQLTLVRHALLGSENNIPDGATKVTLIFENADYADSILNILSNLDKLYGHLCELFDEPKAPIHFAKLETGSPLSITIGGYSLVLLALIKLLRIFFKDVLPLYQVKSEFAKNEGKQRVVREMGETISELERQGFNVANARDRMPQLLDALMDDGERILNLRPILLIDGKQVKPDLEKFETGRVEIKAAPPHLLNGPPNKAIEDKRPSASDTGKSGGTVS